MWSEDCFQAGEKRGVCPVLPGPNFARIVFWGRRFGDRKAIEEQTTTWDKLIIDRQADLFEWVKPLKKVHERHIMILAFANNHYAGHGPATIELFRNL